MEANTIAHRSIDRHAQFQYLFLVCLTRISFSSFFGRMLGRDSRLRGDLGFEAIRDRIGWMAWRVRLTSTKRSQGKDWMHGRMEVGLESLRISKVNIDIDE